MFQEQAGGQKGPRKASWRRRHCAGLQKMSLTEICRKDWETWSAAGNVRAKDVGDRHFQKPGLSDGYSLLLKLLVELGDSVASKKKNLIQFLDKANSVFSWGTLTWESIQFNREVRACTSNSGLECMELSVHLEISPWVRLLEISVDKEPGSSLERSSGTQWPVTTAAQVINSRTRAPEKISRPLLVWSGC